MKLALAAGATTVKFQPFSLIFLTDKAKGMDFFVPPEFEKDFEGVIEKVLDWAGTHKITTNPAAYLRSLPRHLCGHGVGGAPSHCAALWTSCPISAGGDVHPCWVFASKILGNVKINKLSKIWNSDAHNRLRRHLLEKECSGCFMSCYDSNFGKQGLVETFVVKAGKLKRPKFYKRQYFRIYQNARYVVGKIIRRVFGHWLSGSRMKPFDLEPVFEEIQHAREELKKKQKALK